MLSEHEKITLEVPGKPRCCRSSPDVATPSILSKIGASGRRARERWSWKDELVPNIEVDVLIASDHISEIESNFSFVLAREQYV